jgi:hypothetical protein
MSVATAQGSAGEAETKTVALSDVLMTPRQVVIAHVLAYAEANGCTRTACRTQYKCGDTKHDLTHLVYASMADRARHPAVWRAVVSSRHVIRHVVEYLTRCQDPEFPTRV